jgi:hypothetical protein
MLVVTVLFPSQPPTPYARELLQFQYQFRGSHPTPMEHLQDVLNALFGYAHGLGLQDLVG